MMSPQMLKEPPVASTLRSMQVVDVPDVPPSPEFLAAMTAERKTLEGFLARELFSQSVETTMPTQKPQDE